MTIVVIPLYEGVTPLDFVGPYQFFRVLPDMEIIIAALGRDALTADGLTFGNLADLETIKAAISSASPADWGCFRAMEDARFLGAIRRLADGADYVTSVCTGSLILSAAGLLKGRRAACHWAFKELLAAFGAIPDGGRVVRDGNVITGGGITAGVDFALTLIAELRGVDAAQSAQLLLEYSPAPPFQAGVPESAPPHIRAAILDRLATPLADANRRATAVARNLDDAA